MQESANNTYSDAKATVERKLGFYSHLTSYVLVNSGLFFLNLYTSPGYLWAIYPLFGWGIGLLFHAMHVYLRYPNFGCKQDMIEREIEKLNKQNASLHSKHD